jgi:hypothetical protein
VYRSKEKCMAKPTEGEFKPQYIEKKKNMNICFLKDGFRVPASWGLKKMFKVSTLNFHEGMTGQRLLGLCLLPRLKGVLFHDFI